MEFNPCCCISWVAFTRGWDKHWQSDTRTVQWQFTLSLSQSYTQSLSSFKEMETSHKDSNSTVGTCDLWCWGGAVAPQAAWLSLKEQIEEVFVTGSSLHLGWCCVQSKRPVSAVSSIDLWGVSVFFRLPVSCASITSLHFRNGLIFSTRNVHFLFYTYKLFDKWVWPLQVNFSWIFFQCKKIVSMETHFLWHVHSHLVQI